MGTYDEDLQLVIEELKKRGLGTYQSVNPASGLYNLDLLWNRVWNYDSAASAKKSARTARYAMYIAIVSLILNAGMVIMNLVKAS